MTQQDLNFVAQFLKENFTQDYSERKTGFKLEKVGQVSMRGWMNFSKFPSQDQIHVFGTLSLNSLGPVLSLHDLHPVIHHNLSYTVFEE